MIPNGSLRLLLISRHFLKCKQISDTITFLIHSYDHFSMRKRQCSTSWRGAKGYARVYPWNASKRWINYLLCHLKTYTYMHMPMYSYRSSLLCNLNGFMIKVIDMLMCQSGLITCISSLRQSRGTSKVPAQEVSQSPDTLV